MFGCDLTCLTMLGFEILGLWGEVTLKTFVFLWNEIAFHTTSSPGT